MKLVILLLQVREHTIMQIIEQEGIEEGVIFVSLGGFELFSISYPVLYDNSVGLRGHNKEHDNYLIHVDSLVLDKILTTLTEFFLIYVETLIPLRRMGTFIPFVVQ